MRTIQLAIAVALTILLVPPATASAAWLWPVEGNVLTPYRNGDDPYAGGQHRGIDVAAPEGTRVVAAAGGEVLHASTVGSNGLTVSIRTAEGVDTTYLHLASVSVRKGQAVSAGEEVGTVGTTGKRSHDAPHLHFGVRESGSRHAYRDPLAFLPPPVGSPPAPEPSPTPAPVPAAPAPAPRAVPAPRRVPAGRRVPARPRVPAGRRVPAARRVPARPEVPLARPLPVRPRVPAARRVPAHPRLVRRVPARPNVPVQDPVDATRGADRHRGRRPAVGPPPSANPDPRSSPVEPEAPAAGAGDPAPATAGGPTPRPEAGGPGFGLVLACAGLLLAAAILGLTEEGRRTTRRGHAVVRSALVPLLGRR